MTHLFVTDPHVARPSTSLSRTRSAASGPLEIVSGRRPQSDQGSRWLLVLLIFPILTRPVKASSASPTLFAGKSKVNGKLFRLDRLCRLFRSRDIARPLGGSS